MGPSPPRTFAVSVTVWPTVASVRPEMVTTRSDRSCSVTADQALLSKFDALSGAALNVWVSVTL